MSFDASELNSAHKFGVWLDHSTLVVVFTECAALVDGEERPVYLIFEVERGKESAEL